MLHSGSQKEGVFELNIRSRVIAFAAGFLILGGAYFVARPALADDFYLPHIFAEESVTGCADEASFNQLLRGVTADMQEGQLCGPHVVTEQITFLGWHFVDPPNYEDENDLFIVARKYVMATANGPIRFMWPEPLSASDFTFGLEDDFHEEPMDDVPLSPMAEAEFTIASIE